MTQYATWASYGGDARTWLALGLLAAAGAAVLAGIRLPLPVQFTQPGPAGRAAMMVAWATSIAALLVCATIYFRQVIRDIRASGLSAPMPRLTILPVTLTAAAVLFVIIISRRSPDLPTRLASAAIGAIAAPMIFELPFDPIVIFRIHTVLPDPPPWTLVYAPLLLVRDHHAAAAAAVADGAADPGHVLLLRADAGRVGSLGPGRIRLPVGPAADRAEHRVEDPGIRRRLHPVSAPAARARAGTPARKQRAGRPASGAQARTPASCYSLKCELLLTMTFSMGFMTGSISCAMMIASIN